MRLSGAILHPRKDLMLINQKERSAGYPESGRRRKKLGPSPFDERLLP
jgi:hypothetical protein